MRETYRVMLGPLPLAGVLGGPRLAPSRVMTIRPHGYRGLDALDNNGPRLLFADHHERIEKSFDAVLAASRAGDPNVLVEQFRSFERTLLDHLADEERVILPAYQHYHPRDARLIRDDHARIREILSRIGIAVELHAVRAEDMESLIRELRDHAAREDGQMYRWAQIHLPLRGKEAVIVRLSQWLRPLFRPTH